MEDGNEQGAWAELSERELEVLRCLADGLTDDEIAQKLYLSANTIKWHNRQIYQKLEVKNRTQAIVQARASGLLAPNTAASALDDSLMMRQSQLPAPLTSFVGREREIGDVKDLIQEVRLLTLTGPGGTGKTRIALAVAADVANTFEHGVWFVDLAPITQAERVIESIAAIFGMQQGERDLKDMLSQYFRPREMLLILDNFEQVIEAADLVGDLLADAPALRVIVTSREVLKLYGEREFPVPPLRLPERDGHESVGALSGYEAVALFVQRARDANPVFELTDKNASTIVEIVTRLDGLPLAIELAAARVRMFAPEALLARLDDRFKMLTGGARNLPERQQTIYNAIVWSYDLLTHDEQALFARLAVFQGGRSIEAVEAVCMDGLDIDVLDGLESLRNKSLIRQVDGMGGEPRFLMLETIHEFARKQLDLRGESGAVRRSHATFFTERVTQAHKEFRGARQIYWNMWLDMEYANIRTALEWAIDAEEVEIAAQMVSMLAVYWWYAGYHREGLAAFDRVAAFEDALPTSLKIDFLIHGGLILLMEEDREPARASQRAGLALARAEGDEYAEAWALQQLGASYVDTDDHDEFAQAIEMLEVSLEISRRLGDQAGEAQTLNALGEIYRIHGERDKARVFYQACLDVVLETQEKIREALLYDGFGIMDYEDGNYEGALMNFRKEIRLQLDTMSNQPWMAITARHLAASLAQMGHPERAARLIGACEKLGDEMGIYLQAGDRTVFERYGREMREMLGDERYEALVEEGHAMTWEDVLAFVRKVVGES